MKLMKRLLIVFFAVSLIASVAFAEDGLPSIAIFPLNGQYTGSGVIGNPRDNVIQMVTDAFHKTKRFNVIERSQLGSVFTEQKNQSSGLFDEGTAVTLGKQAGASLVVVGSYDITQTQERSVYQGQVSYQFPSKLDLNIRVVDVQTGKIKETVKILARAKEHEESRAYEKLKEDAIVKLEREVSNKYPLAGYVIKVLNDKEALIDLGKKDGITEETVFDVFEYGEDIIHPVTKKVMKGEKKLITEFKLKTLAEETSVVKISGDSTQLKVGLMLESKPKEAGIGESLGNFFNR